MVFVYLLLFPGPPFVSFHTYTIDEPPVPSPDVYKLNMYVIVVL